MNARFPRFYVARLFRVTAKYSSIPDAAYGVTKLRVSRNARRMRGSTPLR
jgi:hypothetical protein